jgi:hypothetical protein
MVSLTLYIGCTGWYLSEFLRVVRPFPSHYPRKLVCEIARHRMMVAMGEGNIHGCTAEDELAVNSMTPGEITGLRGGGGHRGDRDCGAKSHRMRRWRRNLRHQCQNHRYSPGQTQGLMVIGQRDSALRDLAIRTLGRRNGQMMTHSFSLGRRSSSVRRKIGILETETVTGNRRLHSVMLI